MPIGKKAAPAKASKKAKPAKEGAKKRAPKTPAILFKAPADFKPAFYEIEFETLKDGLARGGSLVVNRVKGKWDNPDAKRFNLAEFDLPTLIGISSRLGSIMFAPNLVRRLLPKTQFKVVLRVGRKTENEALTCSVKAVGYLSVSAKTGKPKMKWLNSKTEGSDVLMYRRLRKIGRIGPSAFVEAMLPPSGRKSKKSKEESED